MSCVTGICFLRVSDYLGVTTSLRSAQRLGFVETALGSGTYAKRGAQNAGIAAHYRRRRTSNATYYSPIPSATLALAPGCCVLRGSYGLMLPREDDPLWVSSYPICE